MARFYFVLGALLLVVAIAFLFVGIGRVDNPLTAQVLQQLHCRPNETVGWVLGPYTYSSSNSSGGRSVSFHCENSENQQRDITLPAVLTIVVPFVILILASILAMTRGGQLMARNLTRRATSYFTQFPTQGSPAVIDVHGLENIPQEKMEKVKQVLEMFNVPAGTLNTDDSLTGKLEQLAEAHKKGLISDSEFDRVRQDILDNLAD